MTFILMGFPCFSKTFLNARHFMNLWFNLFFSINDKKKLIRMVYFWIICALIFFCSPSQNAKLLCFLNYFERIGNNPSSNQGNIRFYRQVCWYLHWHSINYSSIYCCKTVNTLNSKKGGGGGKLDIQVPVSNREKALLFQVYNVHIGFI